VCAGGVTVDPHRAGGGNQSRRLGVGAEGTGAEAGGGRRADVHDEFVSR
jgi:hypothetical protein